MSWKSLWYNACKLTIVANRAGLGDNWQSLCDKTADDCSAGGGYGANVYSKLRDAGISARKGTDILAEVGEYTFAQAVDLAGYL